MMCPSKDVKGGIIITEDNFLEAVVQAERMRQHEVVELIASENFPDERVVGACGTEFMNKYAEGYPEKKSVERFKYIFPDYIHTGNIGRYYGGCDCVDMLELYTRYLFQKLFNTDYHVNVQPHSGSQANEAAYAAFIKPGDTILSMSLSNGGHLSHGLPANFSGKLYNIVEYGVDENGFIDYDGIRQRIKEFHPNLVLAGASAYPRIIDFERIRNTIDEECGDKCKKPFFMVDMAHIAGLVATGYHPTPFGFADVITTTTQKTLRSARGGLIFCKPEYAKKVDSAVFPGTQGGPLMNMIYGKACGAEECLKPEYKEYIGKVVSNCKAMCNEFIKMGYEAVTGGTDNHLFLLDFSKTHPNISGRMVQDALDAEGITLNKNCVQNEKRSPMQTSGVRIGTAAMTSKGWEKESFITVAHRIDKVIRGLSA